MNDYKVVKALNNNVLIALDDNQQEVVLIGKGIGFNKSKDSIIPENTVEKLFVLRNEKAQEHYKSLIPDLDENTLNTIISSIEIIRRRTRTILSEKVHVALTDHILFATTRLLNGMAIKNPFLTETKALYPFEYEVAAEVVEFINHSMQIDLPEGEIGFIALHVHSAITDKAVSDVNRYSKLIIQLIEMIEVQLRVTIDREGMEYARLLRHLRYTIERVLNDEIVQEPEKIASLLKSEYPTCYNLSWKIIKIMQQTLKKPVYEAEAVYLTMHLQRLITK
ncbi:RNA-binding antitermination protein GlcT [Oceanobacillus picturae]|jgi:transcriptional antiterminator|uniref:RNA-binding antitermination protein GlcT n=1 Tax=Oceanobacillus picturae TaxID=171693 RepID=A0A0U9H322_9BACI|nr:transcription antiterminator [Oceanobacillus picturae]GAQ16990.1 RNA-binding antitermination protein GlcT [Oceanobacillus picturae]